VISTYVDQLLKEISLGNVTDTNLFNSIISDLGNTEIPMRSKIIHGATCSLIYCWFN
jgi:hypothetical protein